MIVVKSDREIDIMRRAGKIVGRTLKLLKENVKPGITTQELDEIAEIFIAENNGVPAFKGYGGFPASICASVNNEVVHGIPNKKVVLNEGDIISIDVGVIIDEFYGDSAVTIPVGKIDKKAKDLINVTEGCFFEGIKCAKEGYRLSDISHAIQNFVESKGYSVVKDYVGHGIGKQMHEQPQIPNFGSPGRGPRLTKGMTLAIEPMVNVGSAQVYTKSDNWTVVTKDGSLSAHYEHTIAITDKEPEILTLV